MQFSFYSLSTELIVMGFSKMMLDASPVLVVLRGEDLLRRNVAATPGSPVNAPGAALVRRGAYSMGRRSLGETYALGAQHLCSERVKNIKIVQNAADRRASKSHLLTFGVI